jgi:hypothetical protein
MPVKADDAIQPWNRLELHSGAVRCHPVRASLESSLAPGSKPMRLLIAECRDAPVVQLPSGFV